MPDLIPLGRPTMSRDLPRPTAESLERIADALEAIAEALRPKWLPPASQRGSSEPRP